MAGSSKVSDRLAPSDRPFPFLDLPKELRLMVYEWLPVTTRHHTMPNLSSKSDRGIIFVDKVFPSVNILATCRLVHDEAAPVVARKLQCILSQPMQYVVDAEYNEHFISSEYGVLQLLADPTHGRMTDWSQRWSSEHRSDLIDFATKCHDRQRRKRSANPSIPLGTEIILRIGSVDDDQDSEESEEYGTESNQQIQDNGGKDDSDEDEESDDEHVDEGDAKFEWVLMSMRFMHWTSELLHVLVDWHNGGVALDRIHREDPFWAKRRFHIISRGRRSKYWCDWLDDDYLPENHKWQKLSQLREENRRSQLNHPTWQLFCQLRMSNETWKKDWKEGESL